MISGSLTKKNGYWYMILRVRDESGRSKPKWLATHLRADGNKRKAEEMLWAARRDYTDLWEMQKRNFGILFSHYLIAWVKNFHGKVSVGTYTEYQKCIQNRIAPYFEERHIELAKIQPSDILDYYHFLYGKGLTGNTVLHYHVLLRKALEEAKLRGLIMENPTDRIPRPQKCHPSPTATRQRNAESCSMYFKAILWNCRLLLQSYMDCGAVKSWDCAGVQLTLSSGVSPFPILSRWPRSMVAGKSLRQTK